jgi:hypothetical protein
MGLRSWCIDRSAAGGLYAGAPDLIASKIAKKRQTKLPAIAGTK